MSVITREKLNLLFQKEPHAKSITNRHKIIKKVIQDLYPNSYSKIDGIDWIKIIQDILDINYEFEKIIKR